MSLFNQPNALKKEVKLSKVFPITHLNSPSQFETKNGQIGAVIKVEGVPFITEPNSVINQNNQALHQAILSLDDSMLLTVTTHRKKQSVKLDGEFSSDFAKRVDRKYHARFKGKKIFTNHQYLTVVIKGNTATKVSQLTNWAKRFAGTQLGDLHAIQRSQSQRRLDDIIALLLTSLADFNPHLVGTHDKALGYSEMLAFLSLIPNAGEHIRFQMPTYCSPIANGLAETWKEEANYPNGHLGQYLSNKRVIFGENIQFVDAVASDSRFGTLLSMKQYPKETGSVILDNLLEMGCEFICTHSFAPMRATQSMESIRIRREKLNSTEDAARSQIAALEFLEDDVASEKSVMGYHHNTLMLIAQTQEELEEHISAVKQVYGYSGMTLVKEIIEPELIFLSQIPGNHHCIARASQITSQNFADFCSLHNYQTGYYNENFLGSATTLLETPSRTPFYYNFHGRGPKSTPSTGHSAIYGATFAGKTSLLNFMDSQMSRYNNRAFYLDRDLSSKVYILACGNSSYTVVSPECADSVCLNPLLLSDTKENQTFLKDWLNQLVMKEGEQELPSSISELLADCIDYSFTQLEPQYRTLSNITKLLPVDFPRWSELRRWLKGDSTRPDGTYAWIFDNEHDALNLSFDKVGVDVTYLMDKVSQSISTPVYMYLVYRMQAAMDGKRPTGIYIEEAWQVMDAPFWMKNITAWLPTIRKNNGFFVFLTQSPDTVVKSKIGSVIVNNVETSLYFPNRTAERETYIDALKLTESEYEIIQQNIPQSRLFLCKKESERHSVLCKLNLSDLQDELCVLSANKETAIMLDSIIQEKGSDPSDWLETFIQRSQS